VAKDFKEFLRLWQTTHVLSSPHYPQSNGKLEACEVRCEAEAPPSP